MASIIFLKHEAGEIIERIFYRCRVIGRRCYDRPGRRVWK